MPRKFLIRVLVEVDQRTRKLLGYLFKGDCGKIREKEEKTGENVWEKVLECNSIQGKSRDAEFLLLFKSRMLGLVNPLLQLTNLSKRGNIITPNFQKHGTNFQRSRTKLMIDTTDYNRLNNCIVQTK